MKWLLYLLLGYALYYVVLILSELFRSNSGSGSSSDDDTLYISVSDMLSDQQFQARPMELSDEERARMLNEHEQEEDNEQQQATRGTGCLFAQGCDMESYDRERFREGGVKFCPMF